MIHVLPLCINEKFTARWIAEIEWFVDLIKQFFLFNLNINLIFFCIYFWYYLFYLVNLNCDYWCVAFDAVEVFAIFGDGTAKNRKTYPKELLGRFIYFFGIIIVQKNTYVFLEWLEVILPLRKTETILVGLEARSRSKNNTLQ